MTVQDINYVPIQNAGVLYCNGMNLTYVDSTTFEVSDGACRNSTNEVDIIVNTDTGSTTVDFSTIGAVNGLDTGAIEADKMYSVYAIFDPLNNNPSGFLISLSATVPTMPTGYSLWRRIGWISTQDTPIIYGFAQTGAGQTRRYTYLAEHAVLTSGNQTAATAVSLVSLVPPIDTFVDLSVTYVPATQGNDASIKTSLSTGSTLYPMNGIASGIAQNEYINMLAVSNGTVSRIYYSVANGSDALSISVTGFEDYI